MDGKTVIEKSKREKDAKEIESGWKPSPWNDPKKHPDVEKSIVVCKRCKHPR